MDGEWQNCESDKSNNSWIVIHALYWSKTGTVTVQRKEIISPSVVLS